MYVPSEKPNRKESELNCIQFVIVCLELLSKGRNVIAWNSLCRKLVTENVKLSGNHFALVSSVNFSNNIHFDGPLRERERERGGMSCQLRVWEVLCSIPDRGSS